MAKLSDGLVYVTAEEIRRIDDESREFGLDVLQLMENAGGAAAVLARRILGGSVAGRRVLVMAGKGNKGGDGLVAARHLHNWGADVEVALAAERPDMGELATKQLAILEKMRVQVSFGSGAAGPHDLVVDALLGYSTRGPPRPPVNEVIAAANADGAPILAVDLPSGLDPTTGEVYEPCVKAAATITLGFPKIGFLSQSAKHVLGELYLADVSIPAEVYRKHGQATGLFGEGELFKVW